MKTRTLVSAAIGALATFSFANAIACPPPPPGPPPEAGESAESHAARVAAFRAAEEAEHQAWLHQQQVRLWEEADSVFLARIERVRPMELDYWGEVQRVTLRAVRGASALKGRRYTNSFNLAYTEATSCGPIPGFEALRGHVGDTYVVFVRGGRPRQSTVQHTIAPPNITEGRVRALLDVAAGTP